MVHIDTDTDTGIGFDFEFEFATDIDFAGHAKNAPRSLVEVRSASGKSRLVRCHNRLGNYERPRHRGEVASHRRLSLCEAELRRELTGILNGVVEVDVVDDDNFQMIQRDGRDFEINFRKWQDPATGVISVPDAIRSAPKKSKKSSEKSRRHSRRNMYDVALHYSRCRGGKVAHCG
jgi:hypothetical protein